MMMAGQRRRSTWASSRAMALLMCLYAVMSASLCLAAKESAEARPVRYVDSNGREHSISMAELERLAEAQQEKQAELAKMVNKEIKEKKESTMEQLEQEDPLLALHIDMAKHAFDMLQANGYAREYKLVGLSEIDAKIVDPDGDDMTRADQEYRINLYLRMQRIASEPSVQESHTLKAKLSYEVHLLLDAERELSVLAAWEMTPANIRGPRLSIQPSQKVREMLHRRMEEQRKVKPQSVIDVPMVLLAVGVALVLFGGALVYSTQKPQRKPRAPSSDVWELVNDKKHK